MIARHWGTEVVEWEPLPDSKAPKVRPNLEASSQGLEVQSGVRATARQSLLPFLGTRREVAHPNHLLKKVRSVFCWFDR